MFRLLVTGSREWTDMNAIVAEFAVVAQHEGKDVVLVSGGCSSGADAMCELLAKEIGWEVEVHPADWKTEGKSAGFKRNGKMVELGADYCLAFIMNESAGASDTARKAKARRIPTRVIAQSTVRPTRNWVTERTTEKVGA